ncbi:MAG: alpha-galactosidase [Lentisphaerae bacterium]|nr:alpha-galactosidase [Lentisphaerota bacterium]
MTQSHVHSNSHRSVDLRFELPEINTWRVFNKSVSQASFLELIGRWETHGYRFGCVCLDDGWQASGLMGVWEPDPRRFPDVSALSSEIHARGYALRLWMAPAQAHPGTPIYDELWPHGFLHDTKGKPSFYVGLGCYTLDIRNERARQHVFESIQMMARIWDADAFKVDFPPFYQPDDDFYVQRDFDLPEADKERMIADFYGLVRDALDSVRPGLRIEAYPYCHGAAPFIDDMIAGDLVGCERTWEALLERAQGMRDVIGDRATIPWFEMIWGEGADHPHGGVEWHAGFLEYLAASINLEFKLEHSFLPFDYPNAAQIRCLTNRYGPRDRRMKVLVAGRRTFTVADLLEAGMHVDARTRFVVAPEADTLALLHTAALHTNAIDWRGRNVLTGEPIHLRGRNELWGGSHAVCRVEFDARAYQVYELWYEGEVTDYFDRLLPNHLDQAMTQADGLARPAD